MNKVRCRQCREYLHRGDMYRKVGLGWVCSESCLKEMNAPPRVEGSKSRPNQRKQKPDIPAAVRLAVGKRDKFRCRRCGAGSTHLHHITLRSQGGEHVPHNLITLCPKCHALVHTNTKWWTPILRCVVWRSMVEGIDNSTREAERYLGLTHLMEVRHINDDGCWMGPEWVCVLGSTRRSVEVMWAATSGPVTGEVRRLCGQSGCFNPDHLTMS